MCLLLQVMPDLFELDALLAADQLSGLKFDKIFLSRGSWEASSPGGLGMW